MVWLAAAPTRPGQGSADARGLLAALYRRHTGQGMPTLARQPGGKPYFAQGPWHCGISHTREMVFCALAAWPVGLDAEPLNRRVNLNLAKKVLSPQEFAQWQASPAPGELLLTYWTLKEAAVKYSGQGLAGYPNHLSFALDYPQARLALAGPCHCPVRPLLAGLPAGAVATGAGGLPPGVKRPDCPAGGGVHISFIHCFLFVHDLFKYLAYHMGVR